MFDWIPYLTRSQPVDKKDGNFYMKSNDKKQTE